MKKTAITLFAGLALAATAQAGEDYSSKGGKAVIPPPPASCLWTWFAGGSVGEISGDWDEEIYTLHLGVERKCPGQACSHAFYLEVGVTQRDETVSYHDWRVTGQNSYADHDVELDIVPITLNYKYECALTGNFNWYVGAGAGVARTDINIDGPLYDDNDSDTAFYAHIFAGCVYNVSEAFEIFAGARLIFMDDIYSEESPLDEEVHYELGGRFNF